MHIKHIGTCRQHTLYLVLVGRVDLDLVVSNVSIALIPQLIDGYLQTVVQLGLEVSLDHARHRQGELVTKARQLLWTIIGKLITQIYTCTCTLS